MDATPAIADALFSKTQQRVLGLLYGAPERSYYANEIVRIAGMGKGTVIRELQRLDAAGLIASRRRGNQVHYLARRDNPIFEELYRIATKTFGVAMVVNAALLPVEPHIQQAFIHGSITEGPTPTDHEVDLLVVSDTLGFGEVMRCLEEAERQLGRVLNLTLLDTIQFRERVAEARGIYAHMLDRPKIWLKQPPRD